MQLFNHQELQVKEKPPLETQCGACRLHEKSAKVPAYGLGEKGILIIGDYPSKTEIRTLKALSGLTEKVLKPVLQKHGIDYERDVRRINCSSCYYKEDKRVKRKKKGNPIEYCRASVWQEIETFKPKLIILLGDNALQSFLAHRWKTGLDTIKRWRGWQIPDMDVEAYVCPTYSADYVDEMQNSGKLNAVSVLFEQDIEKALQTLSKPQPCMEDYTKRVQILDEEQASDWLRDYHLDAVEFYKINNRKRSFTFDYEATGLKPHRKGHYIYCCSIATSETNVVSFMVKDSKVIKERLKVLLRDDRIEKEAANMKYEMAWSKTILRVDIKGLVWDTMQMAHVLDNRRKVSGLKFQTYIQFGVLDYNSHIEEFLKGEDYKDANSFNKIHLAPQEEILMYCGLDSLFELMLGKVQKKRHRELMKEVGL